MDDNADESTSCDVGPEEELDLVESLRNLLMDQEISDVELEGTDGIRVPANRCILGARSMVFRKMLFGTFVEADTNVVKLGFQGVVIQNIVEYCYTDDVQLGRDGCDDPLARCVVGLILAADYFGFPKLARLLNDLTYVAMHADPTLACAFFDETDIVGSDNNVLLKLNRLAFHMIRLHGSASLIPAIDSGVKRGKGVLSLHPCALEKILADEEICADEYSLYHSLLCWYSRGKCTAERKDIASTLTKYIHFEHIRPSALCNTISFSGLVSPEILSEAYRTQALLAEENKLHFPVLRNRSRVIVEGAGISEVNGEYLPSGEADGVIKYEQKAIWEGQETVFSILRCEQEHWFISITSEYDRESTIHYIDFYKTLAIGCDEECPESEMIWISVSEGDDPPPVVRVLKHADNFPAVQNRVEDSGLLNFTQSTIYEDDANVTGNEHFASVETDITANESHTIYEHPDAANDEPIQLIRETITQ